MFQPFAASHRITLKGIFQLLMPVVAFTVFGGLLWRELATMDLQAITAAIGQVSAVSWIGAAIATWISFQAIGRYDAIWHDILQTGVARSTARHAGIRAIAIAQTVGFGAVTASLVRWRGLPTLNLWQATRLSLAVTLAFTACWVPFALAALWWIGPTASFDISPLLLIAVVGLGVPLGFLARQRFVPQLSAGHLGRLMFWTGTDIVFAAIALFLLLPAGTALPFDMICAAYVVALGLGLLSNSPGGTGAFDLTLLALIPLAAPEPLVAAIIAFRLIYYVLPALLALATMIRLAPQTSPPDHAPSLWNLVPQSGELRTIGGRPWFLGDVPFVSAAIGAQPRPSLNSTDIKTFEQAALRRARLPAFYNCDPRTAHAARQTGWHVRRTAMEAIIRPATWSTAGSKRQTLRRKLRQAIKAGVTVNTTVDKLPMDEMRVIAMDWARHHGGEFGFSMGRFDRQLVGRQRVFIIRHHAVIIGFITFNTNPDEWSLDLIRHRRNLPDGTMQAAIVAAIDHARSEGIKHVSLACVPDPRHTPAFWANTRAGLIQFKRSFAPIWVPRYHATPNKAAFWITGIIIGLAIHRPLPNLPYKVAQWSNRVAQLRLKQRFWFAVRGQT